MRPIAWSEVELNRALKRMAMFQRRGLTPDESEQFADFLNDRDREKTDLRACIECKHYRPGKCAKNQPTLPTTLQRCPFFGWQVPAETKQ